MMPAGGLRRERRARGKPPQKPHPGILRLPAEHVPNRILMEASCQSQRVLGHSSAAQLSAQHTDQVGVVHTENDPAHAGCGEAGKRDFCSIKKCRNWCLV